MKQICRILLLLSFSMVCALASQAADKTNDATTITQEANKAVLKILPFKNKQDFENAKRGLIAELPGGLIETEGRKRPNWDLNQYAFLDALYTIGGETTVDGVDKDNSQRSLGAGVTLGVYFSKTTGITASYGTVVERNDHSQDGKMFRMTFKYLF